MATCYVPIDPAILAEFTMAVGPTPAVAQHMENDSTMAAVPTEVIEPKLESNSTLTDYSTSLTIPNFEDESTVANSRTGLAFPQIEKDPATTHNVGEAISDEVEAGPGTVYRSKGPIDPVTAADSSAASHPLIPSDSDVAGDPTMVTEPTQAVKQQYGLYDADYQQSNGYDAANQQSNGYATAGQNYIGYAMTHQQPTGYITLYDESITPPGPEPLHISNYAQLIELEGYLEVLQPGANGNFGICVDKGGGNYLANVVYQAIPLAYRPPLYIHHQPTMVWGNRLHKALGAFFFSFLMREKSSGILFRVKLWTYVLESPVVAMYISESPRMVRTSGTEPGTTHLCLVADNGIVKL